MMAHTTFLLFLAPIALRRAGGGAEASFVFAASALAMLVAVVPAGWVADRHPRRQVMHAGLVLLSACFLSLILPMAGTNGILLASILAGAGLALLVVPFFAYVADVLDASALPRAYGMVGTLAVLGAAGGPLAGAAIFHLAPDEGAGIAMMAWGLALLCLLAGWLTVALPHATRAVSLAEPTAPIGRAPLRTLVGFSLLFGFIGLSFGLTLPYFALYFLGHEGLTNEAWGILLGVGTAASALALLGAGKFGTRYTTSRFLIGSQGAAAVAALAFIFPLPAGILAAAYVGRTFFAGAYSPIVNASLMEQMPPSARGRAHGWTSLAWNVGWGIGALAGAGILAKYGGILFTLGALAGLVGTLLSVTMIRSQAQGAGKPGNASSIPLRETPSHLPHTERSADAAPGGIPGLGGP